MQSVIVIAMALLLCVYVHCSWCDIVIVVSLVLCVYVHCSWYVTLIVVSLICVCVCGGVGLCMCCLFGKLCYMLCVFVCVVVVFVCVL